jgi:hypothetical protein
MIRRGIVFAAGVLALAAGAWGGPATTTTAPTTQLDKAGPARFAILTSAHARREPPAILVSWHVPAGGTVDLHRRTPGNPLWVKLNTAPMGVEVLQYVDRDVTVGRLYEYAVIRAPQASASGFLWSGIEVAPVEARGKIVLVVESLLAKALAKELALLAYDLIGDGWQVIRHDVGADAPVPKVKELLTREYNNDKQNVRAVYLLGHVGVPYSGNQAPDGHTDHVGAWPADGYYGDMDGVWTDAAISTAANVKPRQKNIPGDGRFDQIAFPSELELAVGRVDLSDITVFAGKGEVELTRQYLRKTHLFRHRKKAYPAKALIADNFHTLNFAAGAWRSFAPMVGSNNITELAGREAAGAVPMLARSGHLWVYGCGAGYWGGAGGVANNGAFVGNSLQAPFWMLFGSYFGDWDVKDSFLRVPLASSDALTCAWAGYPFWYFHPMAMGETVGQCARLSMNNGPPHPSYPLNAGARGVHMALMGDPTLRCFVVAGPSGVRARSLGSAVALDWTASPEAVLGYHVYRADSPAGTFVRLNADLVKATSYTDAAPSKSSEAVYMVRAMALQATPSGSFLNLSQGAFDDAAKRGAAEVR